MYRNIANIPADSVNATIEAPLKSGWRNRVTSNIAFSCTNSRDDEYGEQHGACR